jgi:c-di-GMP-binding flagellar brake protein YcgR
MTYFPQPDPVKRAKRVRLPGSVVFAVHSKGSQPVRAKLHELSATGGLLILSKALEQGDFVEVVFQTSQGKVHGMAEVLSARSKSKSGCLQPFRFVALEDEDHTKLRMTLESLQDQTLIGSSQPSSWSLP